MVYRDNFGKFRSRLSAVRSANAIRQSRLNGRFAKKSTQLWEYFFLGVAIALIAEVAFLLRG